MNKKDLGVVQLVKKGNIVARSEPYYSEYQFKELTKRWNLLYGPAMKKLEIVLILHEEKYDDTVSGVVKLLDYKNNIVESHQYTDTKDWKRKLIEWRRKHRNRFYILKIQFYPIYKPE